MRVRITLAVAAMAIFAAAGCGKHKKKAVIAAGPPPAFAGSYIKSCRNIVSLDGGFIAAECANTQGRFDLSYIKASACKGDIGNQNGVLACNGAVGATTTPPPALASDAAASDTAVSSAPPLKP
jgi:hypothetical protein